MSVSHGRSAASLTIVIPALNEEEAIAGTIERCLAARDQIKAAAGLLEVELIVVSDGSTDRTAEIAPGFAGVKVIEFVPNRGYGAAIQEGWRQGSGTHLGFLDADRAIRGISPRCPGSSVEILRMWFSARGWGRAPECPESDGSATGSTQLLLGFLCGRRVTDTTAQTLVLREVEGARLHVANPARQ